LGLLQDYLRKLKEQREYEKQQKEYSKDSEESESFKELFRKEKVKAFLD
jgi:hypothetical protein